MTLQSSNLAYDSDRNAYRTVTRPALTGYRMWRQTNRVRGVRMTFIRIGGGGEPVVSAPRIFNPAALSQKITK